MTELSTETDELAEAVAQLLAWHQDFVPGGFSQTALEAVQFFRTDAPAPRQPLSYQPGLAFILSGRKIGYLDGTRFEYGVGDYLVVGLPLVFECETFASPEAPLFGLFLTFSPEDLAELRGVLQEHCAEKLSTSASLGVEPLKIGAPMRGALARLVRQLCHPEEAAALGAGTLREVFFHALQDGHGRVLSSLTQLSRPEARIAELLRNVTASGVASPRIEDLARQAGMSSATLHRHFKGVTGYSPSQYFKRQRLVRARQLLVQDGAPVSEVAYAVGYANPTQFSRDFGAYFGHPPSSVRAQTSTRRSV